MAPSSHIKKGQRVRLFGIKKDEYNGLMGTVNGSYNKKKCRFPIKIDEGTAYPGKIVNVEPKNLHILRKGSASSKKKTKVMKRDASISKETAKRDPSIRKAPKRQLSEKRGPDSEEKKRGKSRSKSRNRRTSKSEKRGKSSKSAKRA